MGHLHEIEAFVAVAEHGSFAAAARALAVSSPYVSKRVAGLEARLGVRLLHRTTRHQALTDAGERYHLEAREALRRLAEVEDQLHERAQAVRGPLRLTAPTGLGLQVLAPVLHRFAAAHPEVHLDIHYLDRRVDLIAERFDLAVRVGHLPDSSLVARRVATFRRSVVAAPEALAALPDLEHPRQLEGIAALTYGESTHPRRWVLTKGDASVSVPVTSRLQSNNGQALAEAAAAGLGLTCLPSFHTRALVEAGRLVPVLPAWHDDVPVHVLLPASKGQPRRVRALLDAIAEGCLEAAPPSA